MTAPRHPAHRFASQQQIPVFTTYQDAQEWMDSRSKAYGGIKPFSASDEYKAAYPQIGRLYSEERKGWTKARWADLQVLGLGEDSPVRYLASGVFMGVQLHGYIVNRAGVPYVKLDAKSQGLAGKAMVKWTRNWHADD